MAACIETTWFCRDTSGYIKSAHLGSYIRTFRSFAFPAAAITAVVDEGFGFSPPENAQPSEKEGRQLVLVIDNKDAVRGAFSVDGPTDHLGVQAPDGTSYVLGTDSLDLGLFESVIRGVGSRIGLAAGLEAAHAACFSLDDVGMLVLGSHGQGKSTLLSKLEESFGPGRLRVVDDDWVLFPLGEECLSATPMLPAGEWGSQRAICGESGGTPIRCVLILQPGSRIPLAPVTRLETAREIARGSYHMPNADLSEERRVAAIERSLVNTHCFEGDVWNAEAGEIRALFENVLDVRAPR